MFPSTDRKSTRLNSSHTEIYTLSLHDALPICAKSVGAESLYVAMFDEIDEGTAIYKVSNENHVPLNRSEEHTSELQSHRDLHSFPTRRSSDLCKISRCRISLCSHVR